jgi:chromate transporter
LAATGEIVNAFLLYFLLLKATLTTFSGLASLPVLREDLVINRHVLTDEQLNTAVVVTRTTPGPVGLYVVSVGYFVAGTPGAIAGWFAMCTPALIIIPLIHFAGHRAEHPRAKSVITAVVLSSAGLLWAATVPIARIAITDPLTFMIVVASVGALLTRKVESLWVILGAALVELTAAAFRLVPGL